MNMMRKAPVHKPADHIFFVCIYGSTAQEHMYFSLRTWHSSKWEEKLKWEELENWELDGVYRGGEDPAGMYLRKQETAT